MRSKVLGISLLAALLFPVAPSAQAAESTEVKIGVVDLQRALNETEDGRQAKRRLKALFKKRQASLDTRQNALLAEKETLEKQQKVLSQEAFQKKFTAYQEELMKLQQEYVEYQQELAGKEAELTKKILDKMQEILRRIGQAEGYTLIIEASEGGVVFVPTHLDLTDRVIQRYNSGAKKSAKGK